MKKTCVNCARSCKPEDVKECIKHQYKNFLEPSRKDLGDRRKNDIWKTNDRRKQTRRHIGS